MSLIILHLYIAATNGMEFYAITQLIRIPITIMVVILIFLNFSVKRVIHAELADLQTLAVAMKQTQL